MFNNKELSNKLKEAYEICVKKFDVHMQNYDGLYEFCGSCKNGDYYSECTRQDFFAMYNWMTSFVTGMAPLLYLSTKESKYLRWANRYTDAYTEKIFKYPMDTMHDLGFLYSPYSVAMYKLTGDEQHKRAAIKAADELLKRFDINGRFIDAWQRMDSTEKSGRAIIDSMMNIQLLLWTWKETGHIIYRDAAKAHADTIAKYFVREDYSVCHSIEFDRKTGNVICENNGCGYANGSHWARGTAWAIYGFAKASCYLENIKYYDIACGIADKYMSELKIGEYIPPWDFRLPNSVPAKKCGVADLSDWDETDSNNCCYNVDSSACAITACGLLELNRFTHSDRFADFAINSAVALCGEKYLNKNIGIPGILARQNGQMCYTSYGDYFFVQLLHMILYDIETCW